MERRFALSCTPILLIIVALCGCAVHSEGGTAIHFDDVPRSEVWGEAIYSVCDEGYFVGRDDDHFDPHSHLTRAEAAVLMIRAQHGSDFKPAGTFEEWWMPWVQAAVAHGFMSEPIDPSAPATRADVATLLWLMDA